ncbi:MFS transporter, DHA1 family, multidrug resistance protein B [Terribacillus halophilus]|uniref:MFS transporter, DHA1 family, multidrug resistance protein B n=1 Tax=Terribacillus halophilus TaxID=361279 RepID=A0A1G6RDF3_9BACI|nr:MFS transporter [Terribacillus halophilus]SDD02672.1 MFS transporter, DHA1 family, multidrug resistance protein B [Terribacillus halophilus]
MFKSLHPNIRIRIYTSFMSRMIGSMIFPFMAVYFVREMNATIAGVLMMINVIIQFLASLYGGHLADRIGRKRMMVLGEAAKMIAFIGMVLANMPGFTSAIITFAMLMVISVASGMIMPAQEAMLIDVSTQETRAYMYAINYWANNLAMMIGLTIGGWLFQDYMFQLLIGLAVMSLATLAVTAGFIQETYTVSSMSGEKNNLGLKSLFASYRSVSKDTAFLLFVLGGIAILSLEFQRSNYLTVRMEKDISEMGLSLFGFSFSIDGLRLVSLLTVENTLLIVLFTGVVTKLIKGHNERLVMYAGFILFGAGFIIMAVSNNPFILAAAVLILSVGELMYVPTRQSMLADMVDDTRRGTYMAFHGFVFQFGKLIGAGGIIMGEAVGKYGMGLSYIVLTLLGILFCEMARRQRQVSIMPTSTKEKELI